MSTQRERRLFEALYALAKAAEEVDDGERGPSWRNLRDALAEANRALAYREEGEAATAQASDALPGQAAP